MHVLVTCVVAVASIVSISSAGNFNGGRPFGHHRRTLGAPFGGRSFPRHVGHQRGGQFFPGRYRGHLNDNGSFGGPHHNSYDDEFQYDQEYQGSPYGNPPPYDFTYISEDAEGTHGHNQVSNGQGVRGQYTIQLADGRSRRVDYVADEGGFRAKVDTNEPGTESKNAADAEYRSTALTGPEAAIQFGPAPASRYYDRPDYRPHHGRGFGGHHREYFSRSYNRW
ncbi:cuticle protein 10.9-like [Tropilaelaps mercedesae]|uniref:Cuticle protein 10.9-like n=1 Tax=Tropilaelaps mercedesae TaxID=418985 RepID=A0A1V9X1D9_9ACAR|nr:cuticle protein 10.9-like [Tropilaelaps mercedesae]